MLVFVGNEEHRNKSTHLGEKDCYSSLQFGASTEAIAVYISPLVRNEHDTQHSKFLSVGTVSSEINTSIKTPDFSP